MTDDAPNTGADLEAAQAALDKARAADDAAKAEAHANRTPEQIFVDLLEQMVGHFGNRPAMEAELKLLRWKLKPTS